MIAFANIPIGTPREFSRSISPFERSQNRRRMVHVDIHQHGGYARLTPRKTRAIVSEAAGELLIECFTEICGRRCIRDVDSVAEVTSARQAAG